MVTIKNLNIENQTWQKFLSMQTSSSALTNNDAKPCLAINQNNMIDLIKYPIITEKSYLALVKHQQYTFDIDLRLSKPQIKKLFHICFNVDVIAVNTHIPPRKSMRGGATQGYRARYKRAILTLKKGQSLKFII